MYLQDIILFYKKNKIVNCLPLYDPYKANIRQCNGKCPFQKFNKIVK